jgi:GNAT superfamily N-acetyltransferase
MWWKLSRSEWNTGKKGGNRRKMRRAAGGTLPPGLLAYDSSEPVGWIALEPRRNYARLNSPRLRTLAPLDRQPVWSVTCFFVARSHRRRGVTVELLKAALKHARRHGATMVEGYPVEPRKPQADTFVYTGVASAFRHAGFREAARRSPNRPIMRAPV